MRTYFQQVADSKSDNEKDYQAFEASLFGSDDKKQSLTGRALSKKVYDACVGFLNQNHLASGSAKLSDNQVVIGMEGFSRDADVSSLGTSSIMQLVDAADVPKDKRKDAAFAVYSLLSKFKAAHGNNELYRNQHFAHGSRKDLSASVSSHVNTVFAPSLYGEVTHFGEISEEAFGARIDTVLPDIRASLAVTLLQFHRGVLDRIVHRRTTATPYVKFVQPYAEGYDMLLSNDANDKVRNWGDHIVPFIEYYGDPRQLSNELTKIELLPANDSEGVLVYKDVLKFNKKANLFTLSVIANQLGRSQYNYTDLVSENVKLEKVLVKLTKGNTTEEFYVDMSQLKGSVLNMKPNATDSGERLTDVVYTANFDKNTKTATGQTSAILADCTDTDFLAVRIHVSVSINLKYADVEGMGNITVTGFNTEGGPIAPAVNTLISSVTAELAGYALDARYSEENLRKSNLALRYHIRTFDFEINNGRNILLDYAFEEELPEFLMSLVTEAISLGQDHRGIDVIVKTLMHAFDVTRLENQHPQFRSRLEKIGFEYVAAQLARPVVYMGTLDLANVDSIRSSDEYGDIRNYAEMFFQNLTSKIFQNSFYKHALKPGEKPVFKVLTSSVILDNILAIPHIHNHLNTSEPVDGSNVEYRRVLPNGTVLDCISTSFNYMRDKIIVIPYRESMPDDVLNFGHNWDCGTFMANYNPQQDNGVWKRLFANARSMVIPTMPLGMYVDVKNLSKITDMFEVTSPTPTKLPQPADFVG